MDQPKITVTNNTDQMQYELTLGQDTVGWATYRLRQGVMAVTHTEVAPQVGGQGLGGQLVAAILRDAREQGLRVLPYCPFVRDYIAKRPEHLDLVPTQRRAQFDLPAAADAEDEKLA